MENRKPFEPEMILIPAGEFLMGSASSKDKDHYGDEPDQFKLHLPEYLLGKYPITVGEFRYFVDADGYQNQDYWTDAGWEWRNSDDIIEPIYWNDEKWTGDDRLPVVGVSWYEAYAYTQWLREATGEPYTLPTEAQWEKGAKGGLILSDKSKNPNPGRIYPWGDDYFSGDANIDEKDSGVSDIYLQWTSSVGDYTDGASPYGLLDMSGNVWEWCLSKWASSYQNPENNVVDGTSVRVLRGGSWDDVARYLRVVCRNGVGPLKRVNYIGFRVARS